MGPSPRRYAWCILWPLLLVLAGCAGTTLRLPADHRAFFHDTLFAAPTQPASTTRLFELSPPMRAYLQGAAQPLLKTRGVQQGLVDALYTSGELKLAYDSEITFDAAEAFEARAGNCLSLVIMTAAFAKELGLQVRYREVENRPVWERREGLNLRLGHVNVSLGRPLSMVRMSTASAAWLTVDFMATPEPDDARWWPIEESRIVAMYANNKAAEALAAARLNDAYAWARAAVDADPAFADAYNTLGVVYRRAAHLEPARAALQRAVDLGGERNAHTMGNLAQALTALGRGDEAQAWLVRQRRIDGRQPFADYDAGMQALRDHNPARAREFFERELLKSADWHALHFALGVTYAQLGELPRSERHLALARERSPTRSLRALYGSKLDRLRAQRAVP